MEHVEGREEGGKMMTAGRPGAGFRMAGLGFLRSFSVTGVQECRSVGLCSLPPAGNIIPLLLTNAGLGAGAALTGWKILLWDGEMQSGR